VERWLATTSQPRAAPFSFSVSVRIAEAIRTETEKEERSAAGP
jgi:hypothetical protein